MKCTQQKHVIPKHDPAGPNIDAVTECSVNLRRTRSVMIATLTSSQSSRSLTRRPARLALDRRVLCRNLPLLVSVVGLGRLKGVLDRGELDPIDRDWRRIEVREKCVLSVEFVDHPTRVFLPGVSQAATRSFSSRSSVFAG